MIDLAAALRIVVEALESIGIDYVVVGSTAAAAWGVVRATRDVDVAAAIDSAHIATLLEALDRKDLYVPVESAVAAAAQGGSFNVLHPTSGGKVDVFAVRPDDRFERSRLRRRVRAEILGVPAWIATAEDVVLAKLVWRIDSRSEVQWRDCVEIVGSQVVDGDYLRGWAAELGIAGDLAELLRGCPT